MAEKAHDSDGFDIPGWCAFSVPGIFVLACLATSVSWLGSEYLGAMPTDMRLQYRFFIEFAAGWMRRGEIPLWNPHIFAGTPFLLNTSTTLLYPLNSPLLLMMPQPLSVNLCIILHLFLLPTFMVVYMRGRGASNFAAAFAAMSAAGSAVIAPRVFAGHFTIVSTVAWIPLLLYVHDRMLLNPRRAWPWLAAVLAMMFYAGHIQYFYYAGLVILIRVLLNTGDVGRGLRRKWLAEQFVFHLAAGLIASGVAAAEALPMLDVFSYSERARAQGSEWLKLYSMTPENLLTLIAPGYLGAGTAYFGRWLHWENCFYFGMAGAVMCFWGIARQIRAGRVDPLVWLFLITTALALIGSIPVARNVSAVIPGWSFFRGHGKILAFAIIIGCVLAAEQLDRLRRNVTFRRAGYIFGALVVVGLLGAFVASTDIWKTFLASRFLAVDRTLRYNMADPALMQQAVRTAIISFLTLAAVAGLCAVACAAPRLSPRLRTTVILVVSAVDLYLFAKPGLTTTFPADVMATPVDAAQFFKTMDAPARVAFPNNMTNEAMAFGGESLSGHDINVTRYFNTFVGVVENRPQSAPALAFEVKSEHPLFDAANLKYLAFDQEVAALENLKLHKQFDAGSVWERTTALPRAYVVGAARWVVENEEEIRKALVADINYHEEVLLTGKPDFTAESKFPAVPGKVQYGGLYECRITVPADGILVLADGYAPGWRARVNEDPRPVYRANGTFRAVGPVKTGDVVSFKFSLAPFYSGAAVSAISLLLLMLFLIRSRRPIENDFIAAVQRNKESPGAVSGGL